MISNVAAESIFRSAAHEQQFERDGYFVIAAPIEERFLAPLDAYFAETRSFYEIPFYAGTMAMRSNEEHRRAVNALFRAAIGAAAAELLLAYRQYYGGFGVKPATGDRAVLDLHQDITMVPYTARRTSVTLWVPLCDVDGTNGCIAVLPGSHRFNRLPRAAGAPFAFPDLEEAIAEHHLVYLPMERGSLLVMDQALMHLSGPNRSGVTRVSVMGMYRPVETPLVYYHRCERNGRLMLEVHTVPDDFYLHHQLGRTPKVGRVTAIVPERVAPPPALIRGLGEGASRERSA